MKLSLFIILFEHYALVDLMVELLLRRGCEVHVSLRLETQDDQGDIIIIII